MPWHVRMWWEPLTNEDLRTPSYIKWNIYHVYTFFIHVYIYKSHSYIIYCTYHIYIYLRVSHHAFLLYIFSSKLFHLKDKTTLSQGHPSTPSGAGHVWCRSSGSLGRFSGGWRWENFKDAIATWRRSRALEKKMTGNGKDELRGNMLLCYLKIIHLKHMIDRTCRINGCDNLNHSCMVDMSQKDSGDLYHVNMVWVQDMLEKWR